MQPPAMFTTQLQIMDPLCSVRWGGFTQNWVVERKAVSTPHELKWFLRERERDELTRRAGLMTAAEELDFAGLNEKIVSLQAGKRVLLFADHLGADVIDYLKRRDITGYGGYSRYFEVTERRASEAKALRRAARVALCNDLNVEAYGDGKGRRGIYDYLQDKKRNTVREKLRNGQITLAEAMGLRKDENVLGRGGDVKRAIEVVSR